MEFNKGHRKLAKYLFVIISGVLLLTFIGCSNVLYLSQAIAGHFRIMSSREPIKKLLETNEFDNETKDKLKLALEVREYASRELDLPRNKSYTVFSKVKGQYVGWNIFCAPKFSVEPIQWCFPIAGCVVYRGYFSKNGALKFAGKMEKKGFDVFISPISAYSTLGWYNDPLLSSHLRLDSIHLARLIIHELTHQKFYVPGDSRFNEGFASAVERVGVLRWLKSIGRDDQVVQAIQIQEKDDIKIAKILDARSQLINIYHSKIDPDSMSQKKDSVFNDLKLELSNADHAGINLPKSDEQDIVLNNAYLVPVFTYHSLGPIFQSMLDSVDGNLPQFYNNVKKLGDLPFKERQRKLDSLQIKFLNLKVEEHRIKR